MCGIAGIYEYGRSQGDVSAELLERMRETIHHRGPDGSGQWISEERRVGLAMRRLAILDIQGGDQPMFGSRGEVLVYNGEIYNYPRLREQLEAEGQEFRTTCDTEVILHLYARYGADCVDHLNGMFGFALWDPNEQRLFLARDRIGEKPLYFADVDGTLVFGSEIKAMLEHPRTPRAVNEAALGPYLTNLVTTAPETLYAGISKLPPGYVGFCDADGLRTKRYWDLFSPRAWTPEPREQAARVVREKLDRSVHDRLLADVPVGVLLSGGLDSTTLVGLLREKAKGLATFSVGFDDHPELDERDEARAVAEHFGTDHHEVVLTERDAIESLQSMIHHQDEPLADPVCLPLQAVCALARRNDVPVVLAGEGSDELFWGYPSYQRIVERERWMRAILRLPGLARRQLPALLPPRRFAPAHEVLEGLARGRANPMHMPLGMTRHFRAAILRDPAAADLVGWEPSDAGARNGRVDPMDQLGFDTQEYEFGLRLPELLLMRIDRFSMASSVEARVPFLDPELVEYVYRLPIELKLHQGVSKVVLRDAVRDVVPEWVMNRRKQGFGAPVLQWLGTRLGTLLDQLIDDPEIARYFNVDALRRGLAEDTPRQRQNFGLWPVLNFALWHRYWIQGRELDDLVEPLAAAR